MVYTGLKTGLICELKLFGKKPKITRAVRLSSIEGCDGSYKLMSKCGRPLGMRFNAETNELVVLDAYLGLFVINWTTEKVRQLFTGGAMISNNDNAPPIRYLNDFDFLPDGRIVISESSNKFEDKDFLYDIFEHRPNGRILIYNPSTEDLSVLIDNLYFPNGIQVVQGKILISEMGKTRLLKYSPSSEILSVLLDKLPGYPDNLRLASSGMVWVPLSALRSDEDNWIAERPWLREILTKILSPQAFHFIANCFINKYGMVLKINPMTGEIIESLHDALGRISDISIAVEDGQGNLLLGSDVNYHIARVKL